MRAAVVILAAACGCAHEAKSSETTDPTASPSPAATTAAASASAAATLSAPPPPPPLTWAQRLDPLVFRDVNTLANVMLRLYKNDGNIDETAAAEVDRVLWAAKDDETPHMSRRLLQLVVKAAAHFDAREVVVISSHRGGARKGSRHRSGEAIDFLFPGIPPKQIAALLRTFTRVGVGEYIHPRAQYVHLDVREQSYHWVDGSPPGRTWKEHALPDPTAPTRDAAHSPELDLPAGATVK